MQAAICVFASARLPSAKALCGGLRCFTRISFLTNRSDREDVLVAPGLHDAPRSPLGGDEGSGRRGRTSEVFPSAERVTAANLPAGEALR